MRAIVVNELGGPEVLRLGEAPRPEPRPGLSAVLPLADAAEAHRRLESRQSFGKIVLDVLDAG